MRNDHIKKALDWLDQALERGRTQLPNFSALGKSQKKSDCWGCLVLTDGKETKEVWADDPERETVLRAGAENGFAPVGVLVHYRQEHAGGGTIFTARTPVAFDSRRVDAAARNYLEALSYRYKLRGRVTTTDEVLDDAVAQARSAFWEEFTAIEGEPTRF
jgi:hypothetical protein